MIGCKDVFEALLRQMDSIDNGFNDGVYVVTAVTFRSTVTALMVAAVMWLGLRKR